MYKASVNAKGEHELIIYDEIGDDWFGGVSAKTVLADLKEIPGDAPLTIRLNSPGGDVFDGVAIHSQLKRRTGNNRVIVDGLAASIASVVAMAGDEIIMAKGSMMMIHNPWTMTMGDAADMRRMADLLDTVRENIESIYVERTGAELEWLRGAMAAETWMSAADAVAFGFATSVEGEAKIAACVAEGRYQHTPRQFSLSQQPTPPTPTVWQREIAARRLGLRR